MDTKKSLSEAASEQKGDSSAEMVVWDEKYDTGITLIDDQHKMLVSLINQLHQACRNGNVVETTFVQVLHRVVEYVKLHFTTEQQVMEKMKYPGIKEHKKEHEILVNKIFETAKNFNDGKRFVPHNFARSLREWVLSHIAVIDKQYALYAAEQKRKGINLEIFKELKI